MLNIIWKIYIMFPLGKDDVYDNEIIKLQDVLIDIIINQNYNDDIREGIAGKDDQVPAE